MIPIFPTAPEDTDTRYGRINSGAVEHEVGELLYSLVRVFKPRHILETGTYTGHSTAFMAQALKDNGFGTVITLEIDPEKISMAKTLWNTIGVSDFIESWQVSSLEYDPKINFDMIFLDSEPDIRFRELVKFYPRLNSGNIVLIHDLPRGFCDGNTNPDHPEIKNWPFGLVPDEMKEWLRLGNIQKWHFPTPRELTGFYKRRPDDYDPSK